MVISLCAQEPVGWFILKIQKALLSSWAQRNRKRYRSERTLAALLFSAYSPAREATGILNIQEGHTLHDIERQSCKPSRATVGELTGLIPRLGFGAGYCETRFQGHVGIPLPNSLQIREDLGMGLLYP